MVSEGNETGFTVAIIADEDCEFSAGGKDARAIVDEGGIAFKERGQRWGARQVAGIRSLLK